MSKKYIDALQGKIEAIALKDKAREEKTHICWDNTDEEQKIGFLMLGFNLFYDEAKARWEQAQNQIKTAKKICQKKQNVSLSAQRTCLIKRKTRS